MKKSEHQIKHSDRLYQLVNRLMICSHKKHPDREWTTQFYYDVAFAWMNKLDELERQVLKLELELNLPTESQSDKKEDSHNQSS